MDLTKDQIDGMRQSYREWVIKGKPPLDIKDLGWVVSFDLLNFTADEIKEIENEAEWKIKNGTNKF